MKKKSYEIVAEAMGEGRYSWILAEDDVFVAFGVKEYSTASNARKAGNAFLRSLRGARR